MNGNGKVQRAFYYILVAISSKHVFDSDGLVTNKKFERNLSFVDFVNARTSSVLPDHWRGSRMHDKYTEFKHASHPHKMISLAACIRTEVTVDGIITVYNHNTTNQLTLAPRTLEKYENRKESKTIHIFPHHLFNTLNNEMPCCPTKKEQNSSLHMSTERIKLLEHLCVQEERLHLNTNRISIQLQIST